MTKALSVKNLTKVYKNGVIALNNINLDIHEGDFFALLGKNGAGKSTTIGIICSLIIKTAGNVQVFSYDMDTELAQAKSLIGVVPQEINFNLFETSTQILVNQAGYYGIPKQIALTRAERYLTEMGIWEKRNHPVMQLSGGMKRRLMIARAMMNEPRLLILDEPTAGVDIELRHTLWRFLVKINKSGTTIILTTHYLEEAEQLCKNVAIIDHGEIIEHAAMKNLIGRLNMQTFIIDLEKPINPNTQLKPYQYRIIDDTTVEIELPRGQTINELVNVLNQHHINIYGIRNKTNRLEELFIHLVQTHKHS